MEKIEFLQWLFEGRLRQGKNVLPDGLNCLCYFAGSSKSHHEISISFIFLESHHQVDMKKISNPSNTYLGISVLQKLTVSKVKFPLLRTPKKLNQLTKSSKFRSHCNITIRLNRNIKKSFQIVGWMDCKKSSRAGVKIGKLFGSAG